ncbi:hypothetical protein CCHL11_02287, partial [Colletotrichum chlorophyti]
MEPVPDWMDRMIGTVELIALKLFFDWNTLELIPWHGWITCAELAENSNADEALITQTKNNIVAHTERPQTYLPSTLNEFMFEGHIITGLKLPASRLHTPYAFARGQPEKEIWLIQDVNPEKLKRTMKGIEMAQQLIPLAGIYDFTWVKLKVAEQQDRPILIDVGGGKGHAVKAILEENPFLPSDHIVLQDREEVIDQVAKLNEPELRGVQLHADDFHNVQLSAMGQDSKILAVKYVLPNPPSPVLALTDFAIMEIGGKERTVKDLGNVMARASLKIEKIHGLDMRMQFIECAKA